MRAVEKLLDAPQATVVIAGRTFSKARAVVMGGRLLVFQRVNGAPALVANVRAAELSGRSPSWQVLTDSAETITIERGRGCGCSSPLSSVQPDLFLTQEPIAS